MTVFSKPSAPQGGRSWELLQLPREIVSANCSRLANILGGKKCPVARAPADGDCLFSAVLPGLPGKFQGVASLRQFVAEKVRDPGLAMKIRQSTNFSDNRIPRVVAEVLFEHFKLAVYELWVGEDVVVLAPLLEREVVGRPLVLVRQGERQHFDLLVTSEVDQEAAMAMHAAALANEAKHAEVAAADKSFLKALTERERQEMLKRFADFEAAKAKKEEDADRRLAEALQEEMRKEEQARADAHAEAEAATARLLAEEAQKAEARALAQSKAEQATSLFLAKEAKEEELRKAKEEVETLRFLLAEDADVASELAAQERRVSQLSGELSQLMAELL